MNRRAFTLIELLVVIAIIAILAAILFPVFAQAKLAAKKTQSLSNVKNLATASQIYTADVDDVFPLGTMRDRTLPNFQTGDRFVPVPLTAAVAATIPVGRQAVINSFVYNAMAPYIKSIDILKDPVGTDVDAGTMSMLNGGRVEATAKGITYTYNGLLTGFSGTATANPANVPIFWNGQGDRSLKGAGYSSPWIYCVSQTDESCVYRPSATADCGGASNGGYSSYTTRATTSWDLYNRRILFSYADGHAGSKTVGTGTRGRRDPRTDPFANYNGTNIPTNRYWDANFCHVYMFRPEWDGNPVPNETVTYFPATP